jgi:hypothetical protein
MSRHLPHGPSIFKSLIYIDFFKYLHLLTRLDNNAIAASIETQEEEQKSK